MPTQYHYFYENGDTIIYPEHIQDLQVIDQMWVNRMERERQKLESKNNAAKSPLKQNNKPSGFYGKTYRYK